MYITINDKETFAKIMLTTDHVAKEILWTC